ncbi:sugar phosphate isomerase/epimerase family protein [Sphingobacterium chuzhouense]|uniref:Sugar phosphate isomerase/epimerase n=1 Tax=Sphingobacterium chuzhouense TaxID=1742264 RepID=A0ABR7XT39_9SPHI|nr:sugar phosphate isomerase/epimerase [Sphingobacterium chuzhouense]MBD1422322.1 sugar phosphate isomerase/epimerase [Sphingobacterium chuzhouense]
MKDISRRKFIEVSSLAVLGAVATHGKTLGMPAYIKNLGKPNSMFNGVQIGMITYSFRHLTNDAEQLLKYCIECNISGVELMGDPAEAFAGAPVAPTAPKWGEGSDPTAWKAYAKVLAPWRAQADMKRFEQLRKVYNNAGVKIYAYKPSALGLSNTDSEIHYACQAARALGASHVTVEYPDDLVHTKRLAAIASKYKVFVGYHGHLQQTFTLWDDALAQSKYNAINFDMGHYVAAGFDPQTFIRAKNKRIVSMHLKDRKNKQNGGANLPWGEGDTPIVEVLQQMAKLRHKFPATIELEYPVPKGSNEIKEVAKCVEFARKALKG